jgi:dTMP kinase
VYVLLDLPPDVAAARRSRAHDRMEAAGDDFHRRVRDGFLALAAAAPDRWLVLDGSASVDDVAAVVLSHVTAML